MTTHSYYQKSEVSDDAKPRPAGPGITAVPRALRPWLIVALVGYIVMLAGLPVQMLAFPDMLADSITRDTPGLDPTWLKFAIVGAHVYTIGLHLIDAVLTIWLVAKVLKGRRWARIALTAYLIVASALSLYSAAAGHEYMWNVIACDSLHLLMLALLWLPKPVRRFFATHRAAEHAHPARAS